VDEIPSNTGMGPDEPVGSTRSGHRSRNMVILGGLALVLVAGVILAVMFPTGDRAGTTATVATTTATVATCAEGGTCVLGDIGPGGGIVFYVASTPFTCTPYRVSTCTYLEALPPIDKSFLCDPKIYSSLRPFDGIGFGSQNTYLARDCPGGILQAVKEMTAGGKSDWFIPSKDEMQLAYDNREVIRLPVGTNKDYWSSSLGNASGTAKTFRTDINYWNSNYWAGGSFWAIPMRNF
jgi:hypothetical protein